MPALVVYWPRRLGSPALPTPTPTPQPHDKDVHQLRGFRADASTFCVMGFRADSEGDIIGEFYCSATLELPNASEKPQSMPFLVAAVRGAESTYVPVVALCGATLERRQRCKIVFYDVELAAAGVFAIDRQRSLSASSLDHSAAVTHSPFTHAPELLDQLGQRHIQHARQLRSKQHNSSNARPAGVTERAAFVAGAVAFAPFAVLTSLSTALNAAVTRLHTPQWLPLAGGKSIEDGSQLLALANRRLAAISSWPKRVRHYYRLSTSRSLTFQEKLEALQLVDFAVMVVIDVVVGSFLLSLASHWTRELVQGDPSHSIISAPIHFLQLLRANVTWLMGAPAGFKLNRPLATIVGNGVLLWLDMWDFCFSSVLQQVAKSGGGAAATSPSKLLLLQGAWLAIRTMGATLQLSLVADAVAVCTWSSSWVYQYFAKLNRLQRGLFSSLWNLFLGKKKNVLRQRVDSQEYDISQLLLGTLLFTILVFMVTTTMVFFVFFLLVRTAVSMTLALLKAAVVGLHTLPVATLTVRVFHPSFFSTGMRLEPLAVDHAQSKTAEVTIESVGVGASPSEDRQHRRAIREVLSALAIDDDGVDTTDTTVSSVMDATDCAYFQLKTVSASSGSLMTRLRRYFAKSSPPTDSLSVLSDLPPFHWPRVGEPEATNRPKQD